MHLKKIIYFIISVFLFFQSPFYIIAQKYSKFEKSDTVSIKSKIFNSDRNIILTNSVKNKTDNSISKTIIYFDADDSDLNQMVIQSINNLIVNNESPNSNLVGIMQVDRNKEFLEKDDLTSFIIQELLPYLKQRKYNTEKIVVLGHSFGGYFSTYLFLTHNEIFNSCIAISPAYWPNNKDIFNYLQMLEDDKLDGNFHLSIGNKRWDDISISKYIDELEEKILKTQRKLRFRVNRLDGFSHNATPTVGIGLGISYILKVFTASHETL